MLNPYFDPIFNSMTRIQILAISLIASAGLSAQFPYVATILDEPYADLTEPTSLEIEIGWDDPEVMIPMPFEVTIGEGEPATNLLLTGTGEMLMSMTESGLLNILWPISLDVMDVGVVEAEEFSLIHYEVSGVEPERILKIEWNDVGLYDEISSLGTTELRLNFQVWLYEGENTIEYRFGPNTFPEDLTAFDFLTSGIILDFDYDYYDGLFYTASGNPEEPTWSLTDDFYAFYYSDVMLDGIPSDGTVYRFGPPVSVSETAVAEAMLSIYPNPSSESLWIENASASPSEITIFDALGNVVDQMYMAPLQRMQRNVQNWSPGHYTVRSIQANGNVAVERLMVN
jgi:hypothetical protein